MLPFTDRTLYKIPTKLPPNLLEEAIKQIEATIHQDSVVSLEDVLDKQVRSSKQAWLNWDCWIGGISFNMLMSANNAYFHYELDHFDSGIQSTIYTEGDHYDWHTDWNWTNPMNPPRKLSMTIQLSSGDEYEGGDFEIAHDLERGDPNTKTLGTVICFPSFMPHKVHPVMQGLRKSLVVWFTGPRIK